MTNKLRIIFFGTPAFGLPCLDALLQSQQQLLAIYTQPDKPAGRGKKLTSSAVKNWANQHNIIVHQPNTLKHEVDILSEYNPDIIIVVAYGLLLPQFILNLPKYGCINVHASLLPRWRGASPLQQVILHDDLYSGITIMQMNAGLDTGAILVQKNIKLNHDETTLSLHDKLSCLAPESLLSVLQNIDNIKPILQNDAEATYAGKIFKEQANIDWSNSAIIIARQIRAFYPWPIAFTYLNDLLIKIYRAEVIDFKITYQNIVFGAILNIDKYGMVIATGERQILITELQFAGGKILKVVDWLNSGKALQYLGMVLHGK